ncbi:PAAR domain-containing protein [Pandoraea sp. NPDC090278]|uniref:PAAR domain-containing protein n=1 Tax=Pandoraea sp. NPDC090278 TaxID=3364391 RepID=UPI003839F714
MRRYYLRRGDKSTADGIVIEGDSSMKIYGVDATFVGAKVFCRTCKSDGRIVAHGPRVSSIDLHGREAALDGDICVCKCPRPPSMLASQSSAYMQMDGGALIPSSGSSVAEQLRKPIERPEPKQLTHSRRVYAWNSSTGEPLANQKFIAYVGGVQQIGETDGEGYATIETSGAKSFRIHFIFSAPKRPLRAQQSAKQ